LSLIDFVWLTAKVKMLKAKVFLLALNELNKINQKSSFLCPTLVAKKETMVIFIKRQIENIWDILYLMVFGY
jgi:hypothetical protein